MVRRRQDWPLRLNAWLDSARARPFEWGKHDCVLAAADAVEMMTGEDPAAFFRGLYSTKREAASVLAKHGGLGTMVTAALGEPLATPKLARRGDLVLVENLNGDGPAIAVVVGAFAVGPGKHEAAFCGMGSWKVAWRV